MTEAQRLDDLQIGIEEARKEFALYDESHVSGASLLAILEAFFDLLFELSPIGKLPHSVGVNTLHLEHVGHAAHLHTFGDRITSFLTADERETGNGRVGDQRTT